MAHYAISTNTDATGCPVVVISPAGKVAVYAQPLSKLQALKLVTNLRRHLNKDGGSLDLSKWVVVGATPAKEAAPAKKASRAKKAA